WTAAGSPPRGYLNLRQNFRQGRIRHGGYYPKYLLKLFRRDQVALDERDLVDHHFSVTGPTAILAGDLIEDNRNESQIFTWIAKHNRYAVLQAREEEGGDRHDGAGVREALGTPDERTR